MVAMKRGNRPEGPRGAKGTHRDTESLEGKMGETSGSQTVSTKLRRIAELAKAAPEMAFTTLAHHIGLWYWFDWQPTKPIHSGRPVVAVASPLPPSNSQAPSVDGMPTSSPAPGPHRLDPEPHSPRKSSATSPRTSARTWVRQRQRHQDVAHGDLELAGAGDVLLEDLEWRRQSVEITRASDICVTRRVIRV